MTSWREAVAFSKALTEAATPRPDGQEDQEVAYRVICAATWFVNFRTASRRLALALSGRERMSAIRTNPSPDSASRLQGKTEL